MSFCRWPSLWRFKPGAPGPGANTGTVLPHEAVLLNSLRRMLTVVPQIEHLIGRWYGKGQHDSQRGGGGNTVPTSPATGAPQLCQILTSMLTLFMSSCMLPA